MIDIFKFGFLAVCSGIIFTFGYLSGKLEKKKCDTCDSCKHLISKGKNGAFGRYKCKYEFLSFDKPKEYCAHYQRRTGEE